MKSYLVFLYCLYFGTCSISTADHKTCKGKYSRGVSDYEVVIPKKVNHKGEFISHLIPHEYKRSHYAGKNEADMRMEDKIHYNIPVDGTHQHIELWPNGQFISPGLVIESHTGNNQVKYNKVRDSQCHYQGRVRGKAGPTIALSTCHGLAGVLHVNDNSYIIEPVADHDHNADLEHPHIVYQYDATNVSSPRCGTLANHIARSVLPAPHSEAVHVRAACNNSREKDEETYFFLETLLVLDNSFILYHEPMEVEVYALTVMNMASNLFHEASLEVKLDIVIVRIIRLEEEEDDSTGEINGDTASMLDCFCNWQKEMNVGNDSHPNHHDVAVLLTKSNLCTECNASSDHAEMMGMSKLGGVCTPTDQCVVCEDSGLRLGYVIAHELGHSLGMMHDGNGETTCAGTFDDNSTTVMHPSISMNIKGWSLCSRDNLRAFLFGYLAGCLHDAPADHYYSIHDLLPGVMYDADAQCKAMVSAHATQCEMGSTCTSLNCQVPGLPCMLTHIPPAPGTSCGPNKWCYGHRCVEIGDRPGAVDGGWSPWGPFGKCSRTCGSGVMTSTRQCTAPRPSNGGRYCVGERKRHKVCATSPCDPNGPTFRDVQCAHFNRWTFPEDETNHTWKGIYLNSENPCSLLCVNENKRVVKLRPTVIDGTPCKAGTRDICVAGKCKEIPCDLDMGSNAVEDACGICHGSGTECVVHKGTQVVNVANKELVKLLELKRDTRNIKVEEIGTTRAYLEVKDINGKKILSGKQLGLFKVPGSMAWLGMRQKSEEALYIPGPIKEPIVIFVAAVEACTIQYSFATKKEEQKAYVEGNYKWDFIDWDSCSTHCGPGNQESRARCIEAETGEVEDSYCSQQEKPQQKTRPCFDHPCRTRWLVGDWVQDCRECLFKKNCYRTRLVQCVIPFGEHDGEVATRDDRECVVHTKKPKDKELCPFNPSKLPIPSPGIDHKGFVEPESYSLVNADADKGWNDLLMSDEVEEVVEDADLVDRDSSRDEDNDIVYSREVDFQEIGEDPIERMSSLLKDASDDGDKRWRMY